MVSMRPKMVYLPTCLWYPCIASMGQKLKKLPTCGIHVWYPWDLKWYIYLHVCGIHV